MLRFNVILFALLITYCMASNKCKCRFSIKPRVANGITPVPNGCGAKAKGDFVPELWFNSCCQQHDVCYGVCNSDKVVCDAQFYECMKQTCSEVQNPISRTACKVSAFAFNTAVLELGCFAWIQNQNNYCTVKC